MTEKNNPQVKNTNEYLNEPTVHIESEYFNDMGMTNEKRLEAYLKTTSEQKSPFPQSVFHGTDDRLYGTWVMGNDYRVSTGYYGGYPATYLKRIAALFPDKQRCLHLFAGKVDKTQFSINNADCEQITLDINPDLNPDVVGDCHDLGSSFDEGYFDLILADPPYSVEDAEHYQTTMIKRNVTLKQCLKVLKKGGHIVWLDQVLPQYRKVELKPIAYIGMVKSTNHRFRVITIFEKIV